MIVFGHGSLDPHNLINSEDSLHHLVAAGVEATEIDVRRTVDDRLVLIHDEEYNDGRLVRETPLAERPPDIVEFGAALDICAGMLVNIELKNHPRDEGFDPTERIAELLVAQLRDRAGPDRVIVSCFGMSCIDRVRELDPGVETAHLVFSRRPVDELVGPAAEHGHAAIHPYESMVDAAFVELAHDRGLLVNAWSGFDETESTIEVLCDLGVDGIITADPARALAVIARTEAP